MPAGGATGAGRPRGLAYRAGMRTAVIRQYDFDAAHVLAWHQGKCARLHGHTYRLEVTVARPLDDRGVVMDFAEVDEIVDWHVLAILDHRHLNDVLENPTAERVATYPVRICAASAPAPPPAAVASRRCSQPGGCDHPVGRRPPPSPRPSGQSVASTGASARL